MTRTILLGIASAILLHPASLVAQSERSQEPSPLEVAQTPTQEERVDPQTHSSTWLSARNLDIRNVSSKCVIAFSLDMKFKDSEGKLIATGTTRHFFPKNGKLNCLDPGQTYTPKYSKVILPIDPSGNPTTADITVDFVIFGDGSKWGPGEQLEAKGYLLGRFDAYKQAQSSTEKPN